MNSVAIIFALFVAFLWGIAPLVHKVLLSEMSFKTVLVISSFTYFICTILFALYYRNDLIADSKRVTTQHILVIAAVAITTGFIANLIYFMVLKGNKSYIVSALIYASPIFTLIGGIWLLKEKFTKFSLLGVLFIVAGVVFIAIGDRSDSLVSLRD